MSRLSMIAVTLAGLCAAAPAGAAPFRETVGGWTVFLQGRWCNALNRDPQEFSVAPYNALVFARVSGGDRVEPRLYAWPGAFDPDMPVALSFSLPNVDLPITLTAMTTEDYIVDPDTPLSPEDLGRIGAAGLVTVQVTGAARPVKPLAFRTEGLALVLDSLARCAGAT